MDRSPGRTFTQAASEAWHSIGEPVRLDLVLDAGQVVDGFAHLDGPGPESGVIGARGAGEGGCRGQHGAGGQGAHEVAAREVAAREQHLRHGLPIQPEELLVEGHEARLAHGGQHLLGRNVFGQLWKIERLAPG